MDPSSPFQDLIRRVREGDEEAAAELVRLYAPEVRRIIRLSLTDPRLRRNFDSLDILQSVLAIFFVHVRRGSFVLGQPSQLVRLLAAMARNKLVDHARKACHWKEANADHHFLDAFAGPAERPSQIVSDEDLAQALRAELSDGERRIGELRAAGQEWAEIAATVGGTADSVRKQFNKAIARVCDRFGLTGVKRA